MDEQPKYMNIHTKKVCTIAVRHDRDGKVSYLLSDGTCWSSKLFRERWVKVNVPTDTHNTPVDLQEGSAASQ